MLGKILALQLGSYPKPGPKAIMMPVGFSTTYIFFSPPDLQFSPLFSNFCHTPVYFCHTPLYFRH
jgi:hypothetical protein